VAGLEGINFFIDECLSPTLAQRLNERGINALHPLNAGRRGEADHIVLRRCLDEDRIIVTENAADFRLLIGRVDMHPGLIIFPSIGREGTWRLMERVLDYLGRQENGRDHMFNRVLEVGEDGNIRAYELPPI
jgi:hypothetical protein